MRQVMDAGYCDFPDARLTWIPGSIAPFESAWMVFARVMAANYLTWEELWRLISLPSRGTARSGNDILSGRWVSFVKYASLLREGRTVLERGFLDTLGFPHCVSDTRGIRQCPQCLRVGYHCTLFAIGALTHCPWHRVRLSRGCVHCAMMVRAMIHHDFSEGVTCPECGTQIIDPVRRLAGCADPDLCRAAEDSCEQIVAWWHTVCGKEPTANELLGDALCPAARGHQIKLKWGGLNELELPPECWPWPAPATPAKIVRWQEPPDVGAFDDATREKLAIRYYRSVRRQVFKRFIRRHRRCLSILASAERSDFVCLDRERVCTVCIAYIIWRLAVEQDVESITRELKLMGLIDSGYPHTATNEARLINPSPSCTNHWPASGGAQGCQSGGHWTLRSLSLRGMAPSVDLVPRLLYAEFLRLWMELEVDHVGANLKIEISPLTSGELQLPIVPPGTRGERLASAPMQGFAVLLPDAQWLLDHANERCRQRRSDGVSMFAAHAQLNVDLFSWKGGEFPNPVFRLRCNHGSRSRIFDHVVPFPSYVG